MDNSILVIAGLAAGAYLLTKKKTSIKETNKEKT